MNEILKFIYAIILFQQAVFILVLLFKSKLKAKQQLVIFFILLSLFICAIDRVINIYSSGLSRNFPWSIFILDTFNLLYLPLIYLFVKTIAGKLWKPNWLELIHFIPFIYNFLLVLFCYTLKSAPEQLQIRQSFTSPGFFYTNRLNFYIIDYVRSFQIIYAIISIFHLHKFQNQIKNNTASDSLVLSFLKIILISFVLLWITGFVFRAFIEKYLFPFIDILIISTSTLFIYFGLRKPIELFGTMIFQTPQIKINTRYYEEYKLQLEDFIAKNKTHSDPEITLTKLSEQTGITSRILSETINNCYKMHFFDYINSLRIDEAKKVLKQSDKTILEILYQVGFNSKSAFNRAFLKHTGITPSKYRKEN